MIAELIINDLCNLNCKHCFQGNVKCDSVLDFSNWLNVIDKLAPYVDGFHFAGKEPFIDNKVLHYSSYIREKYSDLYLSVVTNGKTLPTYLDSIIDIGYDNFGVSIDSLTGNNLVREYNGLGNIELLSYRGVSPTIYLTLTKANVKSIVQNIQILNGVAGAFLKFWIIPVLPLANTPKELVISPSDLANCINALIGEEVHGDFTIDIKGSYAEILHYTFDLENGYSFEHKNIQFAVEYECRRFKDSFVVTPDGEMLGCGFEFNKHYKAYSVGNVMHDNVEMMLKLGDMRREDNIQIGEACAEGMKCKVCRNLCPLTLTCYGGKRV